MSLFFLPPRPLVPQLQWFGILFHKTSGYYRLLVLLNAVSKLTSFPFPASHVPHLATEVLEFVHFINFVIIIIIIILKLEMKICLYIYMQSDLQRFWTSNLEWTAWRRFFGTDTFNFLSPT